MRIIFTTCPPENSEKISQTIVGEKLTASCLTIPMKESRFWWKGEIVSRKEDLLLFKTKEGLVDILFARLKEIHPYEVPFIAEIDVEKANNEIEKWINEVTIR